MLPPHWDVVPLRRVLRQLNRPVIEGDNVITAYRDGQVTLRSKRREDGYTFSDTEHGYQGVESGDLVVHALDAFAGAVGVSDSRGKCSPVYHVCGARLRDDLRFVAYALRAMAFNGFLALQAGNVRQRSVDFRTWDTFASVPLARPPSEEQSRLSDYLDAETARVDALIEKKRRLRELLDERRRALIADLVSSAGQVVAIRRVFRVVNGGTPTSDEANWQGEVMWATPVDLAGVDGGRIVSTARTLTREGLHSGSAAVPAGSIVLSTRAPIGYVVETTSELAFNQGCRGLVPRAEVDVRYFRYQLLARRPDLVALGLGSTFAELSSDALASVKVAYPSLRVQRELADQLDAQTARIDALIRKTGQVIDRLTERRQALITAAVTGEPDLAKAAV